MALQPQGLSAACTCAANNLNECLQWFVPQCLTMDCLCTKLPRLDIPQTAWTYAPVDCLEPYKA